MIEKLNLSLVATMVIVMHSILREIKTNYLDWRAYTCIYMYITATIAVYVHEQLEWVCP